MHICACYVCTGKDIPSGLIAISRCDSFPFLSLPFQQHAFFSRSRFTLYTQKFYSRCFGERRRRRRGKLPTTHDNHDASCCTISRYFRFFLALSLSFSFARSFARALQKREVISAYMSLLFFFNALSLLRTALRLIASSSDAVILNRKFVCGERVIKLQLTNSAHYSIFVDYHCTLSFPSFELIASNGISVAVGARESERRCREMGDIFA
jgi:hypothetical protein